MKRRHTISKAKIEEIAGRLRQNAFFGTACQAAGIEEETGNAWKERGKRERRRIETGKVPKKTEGIYLIFLATVEKAQAEAECDAIKYIGDGLPNWQSKAWVQGRRNVERWGAGNKSQEKGVAGGDDKPKSLVFIMPDGSKKSPRELAEADNG
jgi:hypothetical protein